MSGNVFFSLTHQHLDETTRDGYTIKLFQLPWLDPKDWERIE